jgi:hypothetical protein
MTQSDKEQWEKERAKGYNRFLLRSITRVGLPFAALTTVLQLAVNLYGHRAIDPLWELAAKFGVFALGFGAWMGVLTWRGKQHDYNKPTENE